MAVACCLVRDRFGFQIFVGLARSGAWGKGSYSVPVMLSVPLTAWAAHVGPLTKQILVARRGLHQ